MQATNKPAGIQYLGLPGISDACVQALQRLIQYRDRITDAKLLTANAHHCLLLSIDEGDRVAIKSGFSSGYGGEGPKALSRVLQLLLEREIPIVEVEVDSDLLDRLDASSMTERDLATIHSSHSVRPARLYDYIGGDGTSFRTAGQHWSRFPEVIPLAIVDKRIADLAMRFFSAPNDTLLQGFRRLEDTVRTRVNSTEFGAKLFATAFQGDSSPLIWQEVQPGEISGRVNLFTGAYMAHRNPRAHRETEDSSAQLLSEFLVLNHLFALEAAAIERRSCEKTDA